MGHSRTVITTLIENQAGTNPKLVHEHGISFLIQRSDQIVLFDTGQSGAIVENAALLGMDLGAVSDIVLSHGHYDHTNGLPTLIEARKEAGLPMPTLHVHEDFFDRKYKTDTSPPTYNGASWDAAWCRTQGVTVKTVRGHGRSLSPGIHIVTGYDRTHPLEVDNPRFLVDRGNRGDDLVVDDFRDEISLVIETARGLVVVVGCSHPGIMNMLDTIQARFDSPLYAVLGGTHLIEARGARLSEALSYMEDPALGRLGLSHCTGDLAMDILDKRMGVGSPTQPGDPRFFRNVTGSSLVIDPAQ